MVMEFDPMIQTDGAHVLGYIKWCIQCDVIVLLLLLAQWEQQYLYPVANSIFQVKTVCPKVCTVYSVWHPSLNL